MFVWIKEQIVLPDSCKYKAHMWVLKGQKSDTIAMNYLVITEQHLHVRLMGGGMCGLLKQGDLLFAEPSNWSYLQFLKPTFRNVCFFTADFWIKETRC